jgi:hypothetical protein
VIGCLRNGIPIIALLVVAIYSAFPHPSYNQAELKAIAAESRGLMASYPLGPSGHYISIPKDKWPPVITGLKPYSVTVYHGMVDITTKPFFDGGWGYGFALQKRDLTMLVECWSELDQSVYWHGPC